MKRYLAPGMWSIALLALYFMDETSTTSLCPFKFIGFDHCPGCGLGHSIHYTLHLQFQEAFQYHLLGIPSTIALFWLAIKPFITKYTQYEPTTTNDARSSA